MTKQAAEFAISKDMPLSQRLTAMVTLACIGVALQVFVHPLLGWIAVFIAGLLSILSSRNNEPSVIGGGEWQNVTMEEVEKAAALLQKSRKVQSQAGGTSSLGCGVFAAVLLISYALFKIVDQGSIESTIFTPIIQGGSVTVLFVLDSLTLLLPIAASGSVKAWNPPYFDIRITQLMYIYNQFSSDARIQFQPSLSVNKSDEGTVPTDIKMMVKIKDADSGFMGIQIQTSFNDVQGTKYPYTYCVLLAKPEFNLKTKAVHLLDPPPGEAGGLLGLFHNADANEKREAAFHRYNEAIVELKKEGEVDIAVVRQDTSKGTQGYTTSPAQAIDVFTTAYQLTAMVMRQ